MARTKRSRYELKELAKWWLDLSKLVFGSLVIPVFLTDAPQNEKVLIVALGLTASFLLAKIGLNIARNVKDKI